MTTIERLRAVAEAEQLNECLAPGQPYDDDATVNWTNEVRPTAVLALLDERDALRAALKDAIGELHGDPNGYHHCHWCSGVDRHDDTCAWVARNERIAVIREIARAALDRLGGAS